MIYEELMISFGLALVAVLVLSLFVLGKVTVVALVCATVVSGEVTQPGRLLCGVGIVVVTAHVVTLISVFCRQVCLQQAST